jgi:hypothetical protein
VIFSLASGFVAGNRPQARENTSVDTPRTYTDAHGLNYSRTLLFVFEFQFSSFKSLISKDMLPGVQENGILLET